ncbi:MAG: S9 family peptidase [Rhodospirillaceae bacterium]|nr:S9 family peptidase [Rhodospirillaceae bacterium]MYB14297.1 S9 family peptidase [Rhodospirillaceae bacterium]MYI48335.1 S9 family peptidase [Rhodospirillaceae bacterium]
MNAPNSTVPVPPLAARRPVVSHHHGDSRTDDYAWLRDPGYPDVRDPAILDYLKAENAYREAVMAPLAGLQAQLFQELKGRLKDDDSGVPVKRGPWFYSWRFDPEAQYCTHFRIPFEDGPDGAARTILDETALAGGLDYLRVRAVEPSPDHALLAYSADTDGSERFAIRVRDLATGEDLPDVIPDTSGATAWAADSRTLFYVRLDAQLRPSSVWRHRLGTPAEADAEVYREPDPGFGVSVGLGRDERHLFIAAGDHETSEVRFLPANAPETAPQLISARRTGRLYEAEHRDGVLWILTDDTHPNQRLVTAPAENPDAENWREEIAASDSVYLTGLHVFRDWMLIEEREDGVKHLRIRHFGAGGEHRIAFPEPAYAVRPAGNAAFDQAHLRIAYQSLVTPPTVWDYDVVTRERTVRKVQEIPSGYDASLYVSEREMAPSHDGALVPVTTVRRRDTPKDGSAPLYLYAYGSYGMNMDPGFGTARLSLLDRGFVFALANPRGGSELGKNWYEAGRLERKENTFHDVIAVARHLAAAGYARAGNMALAGGSAGGLMVGATINMAPELFRAAAAHVPFVDVLNTMLDETLWLTPGEYPEWGNPTESGEAYRRIAAYSPYDNVEAKDYPHLFVTGGLSDPRVTYWEPAKWVAKLRAAKTDGNLLLLRMNMGAGHGGKSGRYEALHEVAEEYAFMLTVFGPGFDPGA